MPAEYIQLKLSQQPKIKSLPDVSKCNERPFPLSNALMDSAIDSTTNDGINRFCTVTVINSLNAYSSPHVQWQRISQNIKQ